MSLAARKRELRRQVLERRRRLDPASAATAAAAASETIAATPEFRNAAALALYAGVKDELATDGLFARAVSASKACLFPRCMPGSRLDFVAIDAWETLVAGRYGLLEPPADLPAAVLPSGSLVIVPGVAFDGEGNRLGQGAGYYDRAFPTRDARRLTLFGVGFSCQLVERVPVGEFDRKMDGVVTERGILRPGPAT